MIRAEATACAIKASDANMFCYQAWDVPCRTQTPFCGNACMHLQPLVTAELAPGATGVATVRIGLREGDWNGPAAFPA